MRDAEAKLCVVGKDSVRSMLERRWLLFFKRMNIDFEYEPERFPDGVSNIGYLPDMLVHGELYLEIKPTVEIAREEIRKPYGFVRETNKRLLIAIGEPPGDRVIAIMRLDDGRVTYKDVTWMSWAHLGMRSDIDICVETAAANYAMNEADTKIDTPLHRALSKIDGAEDRNV